MTSSATAGGCEIRRQSKFPDADTERLPFFWSSNQRASYAYDKVAFNLAKKAIADVPNDCMGYCNMWIAAETVAKLEIYARKMQRDFPASTILRTNDVVTENGGAAALFTFVTSKTPLPIDKPLVLGLSRAYSRTLCVPQHVFSAASASATAAEAAAAAARRAPTSTHAAPRRSIAKTKK